MYENDFCEYAVTKKKEGSYLVKTVAVSALLCLVAAVAVIILPFAKAVGFVLLAASVTLMWYLSRYLSIEYEYSLTGEYMDFAAIYSMQYRKEKLSVELKKSARRVMPYSGDFGGFAVTKTYDFRSSKNAANQYVMVFEEDGVKYAVLFDANEKMINNMFHQIPSVVTR